MKEHLQRSLKKGNINTEDIDLRNHWRVCQRTQSGSRKICLLVTIR